MLKSLSELLKQNEQNISPQFARTGGPLWIDFENGYVSFPGRNNSENIHSADRISDAVRKLKNRQGPVILIGHPGSGKTVLIRSIGYKLLSESAETVYYFSAKYDANLINPDSFPFEKIKKENAMLFIDDAHIDNAEWISKLYANPECDTKFMACLLIALKPYENNPEYLNPETFHLNRLDIKKYLFRDSLEYIPEIKGSEVADSLIEFWGRKSNYKKDISKHNIIEKCRRWINGSKIVDLHLLTFFLQYLEKNPDTLISDLQINDVVENHIDEVKNETPESKYTDDILFVLAYFSRHDILLPEHVMQKIIALLIEYHKREIPDQNPDIRKTLDTLIDSDKVIFRDNMYSLFSSDCAELYFQILENSNTRCNTIKQIFHDYACVIYPDINITESFRFGMTMFIYENDISISAKITSKESAKTIETISKLNDSASILSNMIRYSSDMKDAVNVTYSFGEICFSGINQIDIELIIDKLKHHHDLWETNDLIRALRESEYTRFDEIESEILVYLINSAKDIRPVADFIDALIESRYSKFNDIPPEIVAEKINSMDDLCQKSRFINALDTAKYSIKNWNRVFNIFTPQCLFEIFIKSPILEDFCDLFSSIKSASFLSDYCNRFLDLIPPQILFNKIRESSKIEYMIRLFSETSLEIIQSIPAEIIIKNINHEKDLAEIGDIIYSLYQSNYPDLNSFSPSVFAEKLIHSNNYLGTADLLDQLYDIDYSSENWSEFFSIINSNTITNIIDKVNDLDEISKLIKILIKINYPEEYWQELFKLLSPDYLITKILNSENIYDISDLFTYLKTAGYPTIRLEESFQLLTPEIISSIIHEKLSSDYHSCFVHQLHKAGYKGFSSISHEQIIRIIMKSKKIDDLSYFLESLYEVGCRSINDIPPEVFCSIISESSNDDSNSDLINALNTMEYPGIREIPPKLISEKILNSIDYEGRNRFISQLISANYPAEQWKTVFEYLTPEILFEKINDSVSILESIVMISILKEAGYPDQKCLTFISYLSPDILEIKIRRDKKLRYPKGLIIHLESIGFTRFDEISPEIIADTIMHTKHTVVAAAIVEGFLKADYSSDNWKKFFKIFTRQALYTRIKSFGEFWSAECLFSALKEAFYKAYPDRKFSDYFTPEILAVIITNIGAMCDALCLIEKLYETEYNEENWNTLIQLFPAEAFLELVKHSRDYDNTADIIAAFVKIGYPLENLREFFVLFPPEVIVNFLSYDIHIWEMSEFIHSLTYANYPEESFQKLLSLIPASLFSKLFKSHRPLKNLSFTIRKFIEVGYQKERIREELENITMGIFTKHLKNNYLEHIYSFIILLKDIGYTKFQKITAEVFSIKTIDDETENEYQDKIIQLLQESNYPNEKLMQIKTYKQSK